MKYVMTCKLPVVAFMEPQEGGTPRHVMLLGSVLKDNLPEAAPVMATGQVPTLMGPHSAWKLSADVTCHLTSDDELAPASSMGKRGCSLALSLLMTAPSISRPANGEAATSCLLTPVHQSRRQLQPLPWGAITSATASAAWVIRGYSQSPGNYLAIIEVRKRGNPPETASKLRPAFPSAAVAAPRLATWRREGAYNRDNMYQVDRP